MTRRAWESETAPAGRGGKSGEREGEQARDRDCSSTRDELGREAERAADDVDLTGVVSELSRLLRRIRTVGDGLRNDRPEAERIEPGGRQPRRQRSGNSHRLAPTRCRQRDASDEEAE